MVDQLIPILAVGVCLVGFIIVVFHPDFVLFEDDCDYGP